MSKPLNVYRIIEVEGLGFVPQVEQHPWWIEKILGCEDPVWVSLIEADRDALPEMAWKVVARETVGEVRVIIQKNLVHELHQEKGWKIKRVIAQ